MLQNLAGRSPIFSKKEAYAVRDSRQALVRASGYTRLSRPICNRRRKPPWRKKRAGLGRLQIDCQVARLHRFVALFDPLGIFRFVWPESCVPIPQDRKYRQCKRDPNRHARFDRLEQSRKRNRKNQKEKIRPACLPNRQQVSRDKKSKNKDWCGATAGRADFSFAKAKPNKKRGDEK